MRCALVVGMVLAVGFLPGVAARADAAGPLVRFATTLGTIDVQLLSDDAPATVTNFMGYVNRGDYNGTFFHRSDPGFVIQGGGFRFSGGQPVAAPSGPAVINEFKVSNTRGTLAMAKIGGDPNSATNQWFFNLADSNAPVLDPQNGGFTVFGRIVAGIDVMDTIAAQRVVNASATFGATFNELPVFDYPTGTTPAAENLVTINSITVLSTGSGPDATPPVIVARRPQTGDRYTQGQPVSPDYACEDGSGSGIASCSAPYAVDTDNVGERTFTITATDKAGNKATQTVTYHVDPPAPVVSAPVVDPATPAPAPAPPATVAPTTNAAAAPVLSGAVRTTPRGLVSLALRCRAAARCRGRVGLTAPRGAGRQKATRVAIGAAAYSVAAGGTGRVTVRLNATGRRLLARGRGRLAVVLTITPSGEGGRAVTRALTLRAARAR